MRLNDVSFSFPEENLLFDDVLLHLAEQGKSGEVLRFWESPEVCVVLGRTGNPEQELLREAVDHDGIKIFRRSSGGGTVLQGPGCLNYTLILDKESDPRLQDIRKSYEVILDKVIRVLSACDIRAEFRPVSDLVLPGKEMKFSGNAQKRGRRFILHHGTFLYDFPLGLISKYLRVPEDVPDYRQGRAHQEFVTNLAVSRELIKTAFIRHFASHLTEKTLSRQASQCLLESRDRMRDGAVYSI
ncbi:MAG: lipoate--protein ligase family protein [Candidatus Omnitrophota bacterium]|jgi:lipoate-protein ligase A